MRPLLLLPLAAWGLRACYHGVSASEHAEPGVCEVPPRPVSGWLCSSGVCKKVLLEMPSANMSSAISNPCTPVPFNGRRREGTRPAGRPLREPGLGLTLWQDERCPGQEARGPES